MQPYRVASDVYVFEQEHTLALGVNVGYQVRGKVVEFYEQRIILVVRVELDWT